MSLCCIYHKTLPMQVMEEENADKLVSSGNWFRHPNDVHKVKKEITHEKPIRQRSGKGCSNGKDSPKPSGNNA